jgi:hypothetical protein
MKRTGVLAVCVAVLCAVLIGVVCVGADRKDPFGTVGNSLALFRAMEESYTDDMIDSGCTLVSCAASCDQWATGWQCWGRAIYERYGFDGEWHDLPIQVDVVARCKVTVFTTKSCTAADSETGDGRVTAFDDCWINQIFSGIGWVDSGGCACTEL